MSVKILAVVQLFFFVIFVDEMLESPAALTNRSSPDCQKVTVIMLSNAIMNYVLSTTSYALW